MATLVAVDAKNIAAGVGEKLYAFGSQVCKGNIGSFTPNPIKKPRYTILRAIIFP